MYPDEFDYYEADSIEDALDLLKEHEEADAELLAGGHSLLPAMKLGLSSPDVLIDLNDIDAMQGVKVNDDTLLIGAMTRYSDLVESEAVSKHAPALHKATRQVGDVQVRYRGTIGGNLAHADPASDLPGAALVSDATLTVEGRDGDRSIPADDFFQGMYNTKVGSDELLTRVEIPLADGGVGAYAKKPSPSSGYAMVGVAAFIESNNGTVESARVAANGVMDHGVRLGPVEDYLEESSLDGETITTAASHAGDDLDQTMMMDDLQASNEFRAQLVEVYTERALTDVMNAMA